MIIIILIRDITTTRIVMANPNPEDPNVLNENVPEENSYHLLDYDEEKDPEMDIEEEEPEEDPAEEAEDEPEAEDADDELEVEEAETGRTEVALLESEAKIGKMEREILIMI
uniref:Uncharacterized protein n=1 Tax=Tanacetum cinerariifolium TaxID=118510 RepID=A0A699RQT0_TANCI|nr:hypothetical protein [Tanacetum cinerariifolium]